MRTTKKSRVIHTVVCLTVFIFIILNIVWMINYNAYFKFANGYEDRHKCLGKKVDGYNYTLKCPDYPTLQGNFAISNDKDDLCILIWPDLFIRGHYTYGIQIYDETSNETYEFFVDRKLDTNVPANNFSNQTEEDVNYLLSINLKEFEQMYFLAKEEWALN